MTWASGMCMTLSTAGVICTRVFARVACFSQLRPSQTVTQRATHCELFGHLGELGAELAEFGQFVRVAGLAAWEAISVVEMH